MFKKFYQNNKRSIIMIAAVLLLSGGVTAYLIGFSAEVETPEEDKNVRLVQTESLQYESYTLNVTGQGFIEAARTLNLSGNAGGQVIYSYKGLKSGTAVEEGTLLVKLDDELIRNNLALARSGLISSTAQLLSAYKSEGGAAYTRWNSYLKSLNTENGITPPLPEMSSEREKLLLSTYGVLAAYYSVRELEEALEDCQIYAPFSGHISGNGVEEFSFISPGQPLLTLTDTLHLEIAIPLTREELILLETLNPEVQISPADLPEKTTPGRIERQDAVMDRNSQTIDLHIAFENPELDTLFLPGNYADVRIEGRRLDRALILPRALLNSDQTINVFEEGKLKKYPVSVATTKGEYMILEPTLPEGVQIIRTRIQKPFEGMELKREGSEE
ncbi:MAG: efflux RND transporter periplasmic adaptor subunit [Spirochaetales bacterium]|nr:efflux RND transporter periplasmic adaptor subunit [Spirochaetales bacterium]